MLILPSYKMTLLERLRDAIWARYASYEKVRTYFDLWCNVYKSDGRYGYFEIEYADSEYKKIDVLGTLKNMDDATLLRVAIDMGVDTPGFLPSIPIFRNDIKSEYNTVSKILDSAYGKIATEPDVAIGLANSALESIIKEILKATNSQENWTSKNTLSSLIKTICDEFKFKTTADFPIQLRRISSSLIAACSAIEELRSGMTSVHGKTDEDYMINNPMYAMFIFNSVCTVAMFLKSFYEAKYKENHQGIEDLPLLEECDLPF